jgi:NAD(P)H-dependent FMN reductase
VSSPSSSHPQSSPRPPALKLVVIVGTVRSDRKGIRAARFVERELRGRGHQVTVVDPLVERLPLLDRMYKEYEPGTAPAVLERLATLYKGADGFVVVSGEYNHSIPPALSNLLDHFLEEYFFRPSAIVCYSAGPFGGVRAMVQLRAMLAELGMPSISSHFPIPAIERALDEQGAPPDGTLAERFKRFAGELEWYADALRVARRAGTPY